MSDLAQLGLRVESQEVEVAEKRLDDLTGASNRAERATDGLSAGSAKANSAIASLLASVDRTTREMLELQRAHQQATGAAASQTAATTSLNREVTEAATAVRFYGASFSTVQIGMGGAAASAREYVAATRQVRSAGEQVNGHMLAYQRHLKDVKNGQVETAKATKATAIETLGLTRQLADIGVTAGSGMSPWLILLQQGPQVVDIFQQAKIEGRSFNDVMGGMGEMAGGLVRQFLPLGLAIGAGTLALAPFISAMRETNEEAERLKEFDRTLKTIGDSSSYTAAGLSNISDRLQDIGFKAADANLLLMEMAREGVSSAYLERFATTARDVSVVLGVDLARASEMVSQGFTQNVSDILKLDDQLGFLSETERKHIEVLQESKREAEARTEAFGIFEARYAEANAKMAGPWTQTVRNLSSAWGAFVDTVNFIDWSKARAEINSLLGLLARLTSLLPGARTSTYEATGKRIIELEQERVQQIGLAATNRNRNQLAFAGNNERRIQQLDRDLADLRQRQGQQALLQGISPISAPPVATDTTNRPPAISGGGGRPRSTGGATAQTADRTLEDARRYRDALQLEQEQLGLTSIERERANAYLRADELLKKSNTEATRALAQEIKSEADALAIMRQDADLKDFKKVELRPLDVSAPELVNPLREIADELRLIDDLANDAGRGLSSAFGESGRALGDMLTNLSFYQSRLAEIALAESENRLTGAQADRDRAAAAVQSYGDMAAAARGFFQEGTDGYRLLQAAEQAWRLFQFAMSIQSMAQDAAETASSVANSTARGTAATASGAARMFETLGPLGFPAVAAMLALLAGLGLSRGGSKGGASAAVETSLDTADTYTRQDEAARTSFASTVAQSVKVEIGVNDDRFNASVREATAPDIARAATGVYQTAAQTIPAQQARSSRQQLGRGIG